MAAWVMLGFAILFVAVAVSVAVQHGRAQHPRRHGVEMSDEDVRRLTDDEESD